MTSLDLAVIGNCTFNALVNEEGRIVWCCLPRPDGDPVFNQLLNQTEPDQPPDAGYYAVMIQDFERSEQYYIANTAVLVTRLYDKHGGVVEITDFAPRFRQLGRVFRPTMIARIVRPVRGSPRIQVCLRPTGGYGAERPQITHGSNHIRYVSTGLTLRLSTDAPLTYVLNETPFHLQDKISLLLGPDETFTSSISGAVRDFYEKTVEYWREYVHQLALPFEWQDVVIRAAITLKMCSFEETGAIIAAATTSIPESPNSGRNWDYRYCWLRDTFFVLRALNALTALDTMEGFLGYISNVIATSEEGHLQPVYGIGLETNMPERDIEQLEGYRGMGPVRAGNQAFEHLQHDVYGDVILAAIQAFFDERLFRRPGMADFLSMESLGERAYALHNQPDAGMWELRTRADVHTTSSIMCWAACDRLAKIAAHLSERRETEQGEQLRERAEYWRARAEEIRTTIIERAWNEEMQSFTATFGGETVDAGLLLMPIIGFMKATEPKFLGTLEAIERHLRKGKHLYRYGNEDDFGAPENAFNICTFWYIEVLHAVGREQEAREIFENMLACRNHLGLLSEDIDARTNELWGNFPQTYSMVGLIHSATLLSRPWEDEL